MSKNDTLDDGMVNNSSVAVMAKGGSREVLPSRAQVRAARALLSWTQEQLADAVGITPQTVRLLETGQRTPFSRTLRAIKQTFENVGIVFVSEGKGVGVMLFAPDD